MNVLFRREPLNPNISLWNVSSVVSVANTLHAATMFNRDISPWDICKVTGIDYLFQDMMSFSKKIGWFHHLNILPYLIFYQTMGCDVKKDLQQDLDLHIKVQFNVFNI